MEDVRKTKRPRNPLGRSRESPRSNQHALHGREYRQADCKIMILEGYKTTVCETSRKVRCRISEISYRSGGGAFRFLSSSIFFRNSSNFGLCSGVRIARIWLRPFCLA